MRFLGPTRNTKRKLSLLNTAGMAMVVFAVPVYAQTLDTGALPSGGVVVGGQASLDYATPNELHVNQQTDRAVIDWNRFDIGNNALAQFHQPSSASLTVNRVTGEGDPTQILGQLKANGRIMVLDRNGVFFGEHAQIDVGSIIVSTGNITNKNAMEGNVLSIDDIEPNGFIVNKGNITVKDAGLAAFVAPTVINAGVITAKLGRVDLGAGSRATIDLYGDGLVELAMTKAMSQSLVNSGIINAEGGTVRLQAAASADIVNNVINNTGIIAADTVGTHKGKIILHAAGANMTAAKGRSVTANDGYLSAAGYDSDETGGSIDILGDAVFLGPKGLVDTSGQSGGGTIRIGGDYLGSGDTPTSLYTYADKNSLILNNAIANGNGGKTILWSDDTTDFYGSIYGRGGLNGGNGGFVETSGKKDLLAQGYVDLTAANGHKGVYLLDPANITIYGNFDPTDVSGLRVWLDASDQSTLYSDLAGTTPITNGGSIARWNDKSGNGFDVTQSTAGNRPVWNANAQNSLGAVHFDGTNDSLSTTLNLLAGSNDVSIFAMTSPAGTQPTYSDIVDYNHPAGGFVLQQYVNEINNYAFAYANGAGFYPDYLSANSVQLATGQAQLLTAIKDGTNTDLYLNGLSKQAFTGQPATINNSNGSSQLVIGDFAGGGGRNFNGNILDLLIYNNALSDDNAALVSQYESAKWNVALDPLAGAGTEIAEATGATGYGVFTTRYLERLSNTADIVLQATNDITLDFQGDALTLANDRSITLNTTSGDIKTASTGSIVTNRTTTGGNITFTSGDDIDFAHAFTLNAQGGGQIQLTANDALTASAGLTVTNGDLSADAQSIGGTYTGKDADLDSNAGALNATVTFDTLNIDGASATLLAGRIGAAGPADQTMANRITINNASGTGLPLYTFAGFNIGASTAPPSSGGLDPATDSQLASVDQQSSNFEDTYYEEEGLGDSFVEKALARIGHETGSQSADCLVSMEQVGCVVN